MATLLPKLLKMSSAWDSWCHKTSINTLRPRQNGRHFPDDTFKRIFLNENIIISIKISPKFVPKGPINNIPPLVQIMAWRWPGDKPLSDPMVVSLMTHICVTRPQWVNGVLLNQQIVNFYISFLYYFHLPNSIHSFFCVLFFPLQLCFLFLWVVLYENMFVNALSGTLMICCEMASIYGDNVH